MDRQSLVDHIYSSSFTPELWPETLHELSAIVEARGAGLIAASARANGWRASPGLHEDLAAYFAEGWFLRSPRHPRLFASRHAGFLTEHDLYSDAELAVEPHYNDFSRRRGLGWSARTALALPTGDVIALLVERDYSRGPVEPRVIAELDALRPHLARSALMSARLHLERARAATETLALIGLPALAFDRQAKVIAANDLIEALTDRIRWRAQDRVTMADSSADAIFRQAVETLETETAPAPRSFAVRSLDASAAMVAHVIPIRGAARDIFANCTGVLVMTPVALPQAPSIELVQSLFDLTPAEARVARGVTTGETLDRIASAGGVTRNTVRSQLRGALEKTGCNRQAELVALLGGIMPRLVDPPR
jgi:DNA-binding CsgD family transcriptional regulator